MHVGFWLSNWGSSPLIGGLERGFAQLGHTVSTHRNGERYGLILVANQTAHTQDYLYPPFPTCMAPIAFVDSAEYGERRGNVCYDAFAPASLEHDTKNRVQQERLRDWLADRPHQYFLREFLKSREYPPHYHPIDYPLYYSSVCTKEPDREEYMRRVVDVACLWGLSNQARLGITQTIKNSCVRKDVYVIEHDGPRIPQPEYFRRIEAARCSVNYDGYGSSSFRMTECLVRTCLLLGPLSIKTREPLVDGRTCIAYTPENLEDQLLFVAGNPERAFDIYRQGHAWCMQHYTESATAKYVLKTMGL